MLLHRTLLLVIAGLAPSIAHAQNPPSAAGVTPGTDLDAFDVASVRPSQSGGGLPIGFQRTPDGMEANLTVRLLIMVAFGGLTVIPTNDSITGLPPWAENEYFTVRAKMNQAQMAQLTKLNESEQEQRREAMLQALLADEFKLKLHRELKQVPDYDLVVAKGGPKFKERDPNNPANRVGDMVRDRNGDLQMFGGFTMETLAAVLAQPMIGAGRLVRDKTGLTGMYDLTLNFAPVQRISNLPEGAAGGPAPSIFTALQEQLGLKLQPSTGTINVVVVDNVERPTGN